MRASCRNMMIFALNADVITKDYIIIDVGYIPKELLCFLSNTFFKIVYLKMHTILKKYVGINLGCVPHPS